MASVNEGYQKAQSDNLPKIDAVMMSNYFSSNPNFTSAEIKGVKATRSERESYGDTAVGYVQVRRAGSMCVVKARITPEHSVKNKCYSVTATCDEAEQSVVSVECEDCAAHMGGCKHAIAFLAWLHRRSEEPPSTDVSCYWKKSKLSKVGSDLKFIKAKDLGGRPANAAIPGPSTQSFLSVVVNHARTVNDMNNQLTKYYKEWSNIEKLSVHYLISTMPCKPVDAEEFISQCKLIMDKASCEEANAATLDQSDCPLWYELRYARITASKAYNAAHCKLLNGTLVESIMGASKLKDTEAMKRGRVLEKEVLKEIEKKMKIKIKRCGVKLNPNYPILAASPDGESSEHIIEVKCPISDKTMRNYITKDNQICSKHMAQVQLGMHFSKKVKALFCVAHSDFETTRNINILPIEYDQQLCESIIEKCVLFWSNAIFPLINK